MFNSILVVEIWCGATRTLKHIHEFMRRLADSKWSDRFLRKSSIEDALVEYSRLLDDAAQSFQVGPVLSHIISMLIIVTQLATLIDLHYTIGTLSQKNTENIGFQLTQATAPLQIEAPPPYKKKQTLDLDVNEPEIAESSVTAINVSELTISPLDESISLQSEESITEIATDGTQDFLNDHYLPEQLSSLTLENNHGVLLNALCIFASHLLRQFRRYHQSELILRGRSCLKEGWWAGSMEVQVQGQPALIKRYDDAKDEAARVSVYFSHAQQS